MKAAQWKATTNQASKTLWRPQPGPQTRAYESEADVMGYGGSAGGGKTDLLLGLAGTQHRRSLILRREFPRLRGMMERSREIFNPDNTPHLKDSFNEQLHVWRLHHAVERTLEFGAVQYEKDKGKYQGQPHDFLGFDEVTEFPKSVVQFLMAWNRTTIPGQRCRVVMTFNPPMDDIGEWINSYYAPWLDETHPRPAVDGELRWYAVLDGQEQEVENGEAFDHQRETVIPKSRTFFHASLKDNPALEVTGYAATLDALPEPLRSFLKGQFDAARVLNPYQVIPTSWIRLAQQRWRESAPASNLQTALGVDVARGGKDQTVIAERRGEWITSLTKLPGKDTPDGPSVVTLIVAILSGDPIVNIDVIGVGSSVYDHARDLCRARAINFGEGTSAMDKSGRIKLANVRAEAYWKLREWLDPDGGHAVCLPDDRELLADLSAPKWELRSGRLYIESKEDIIDRLGHSPDCGDAVALAFYGSDPLAQGTVSRANPASTSRFIRTQPTGSRWGRGDPSKGWHR